MHDYVYRHSVLCDLLKSFRLQPRPYIDRFGLLVKLDDHIFNSSEGSSVFEGKPKQF